jgi:hypothetical protein
MPPSRVAVARPRRTATKATPTTVDFPPTTSKRLKDLKDILEAPSHIDVLRRALAFYEEAVKAKKDGGRIYIEKANGEKLEMSQLAAA